ncbi:MAG: hypothetical protein K2J77_11590 [Oscillospiraceae bacterium]|nr:hypothetical protein [Oscillospiraceae bacterium]
MNSKDFSEAMNLLDSKYIDEAIGYQSKRKVNGWLKFGAAAACLMLIVGVVFWKQTTHNGRRVISEYPTNSSVSYVSTPAPGEVMFAIELKEARKKYAGKNVTFLLTFDMFKDHGELSEKERIAEYQRLFSLGYELYTAECWTYQGEGEKRYYTKVVGYFNESDLTLFRSNPEYGYMFYFLTDGDGSGISVDKTDIITDFPGNIC